MNLALIFEILQLGLSVAQANTTGVAKSKEETAQALITMIQNAKTALEQHTGEPIDPSLIFPELPYTPPSIPA